MRGGSGPLVMAGIGVAAVAVGAAVLGIGIPNDPVAQLAGDEPQYALTALSLAEDGDLDIADELAEGRWRAFSDAVPFRQTAVLADGSRLSPHDPLLSLLLAAPMGLGGWATAKLTVAMLAGALAALTLWTAVRRVAVPLPLAAAGVGVAAASAPLAVYGQQLYPELPAALLTLVGVAALTLDPASRSSAVTGSARRAPLALVVVAVVALPWLSVKYVPVAAVLAMLACRRWWRAGRRGEVLGAGAVLALLAGVYVAVHRALWGGWTVYASAHNPGGAGEFSVVGDDPDFLSRSLRLVGLLVDGRYGIAVWQPAWLLVLPALGALLARRPAGWTALALPLAAGWLVATFPASTMHGYWWPGRQVVVVLPLALLVLLWWLARTGVAARAVAAVPGLAGVITYGWLLTQGHAGEITWTSMFTEPGAPGTPAYQAVRPLLLDYREFRPAQLAWIAGCALLAAAGWRSQRRRAPDAVSLPEPAGAGTAGRPSP
ncbi:MAG: hypothetical protein GEV09_24210 [Pseudonocardiaceae bacterium]|nr:hypothetical protein [Pseudonocardiaceae bacterium]